MASNRPPACPPDTSNEDMNEYYGLDSRPGSETWSENASVNPQNEEKMFASSAARTHPVLFTVMQDNNVTRFLQNLLAHLQIVDMKACLVTKPESQVGEIHLRHMSQKPVDVTSTQFVDWYVAGLKARATQLKGKVWILSNLKFSTFKKHSLFQKWLTGSDKTPKIRLKRTSLPGNTRHNCGIFFNTVTRYDCISDFKATICAKLLSKSNGYEIPEFELDIQYIFRKTSSSVYKMMASTKKDTK
jgi:hypothetical protein